MLKLKTSKYLFSRFTLFKQYKTLIHIAKPQRYKYYKNILYTLSSAALFMYIPNIYPDISHLMSLNINVNTLQQIQYDYLITTGKWGLIFGLSAILTYTRRYQFLDIENRISTRLRYIFYKNILNSEIYKKKVSGQAYVHHIVTDIKSVSQFMGQTIFHGLRGFSFLIGGVTCLVITTPQLSLICIVIMSIFNLIFRKKNIRLKTLKTQQNEVLKQISQYTVQRFNNIKLIKISNTKSLQELSYLKELSNLYQFSTKVAKANGLNYGLLEGLGLLSLFSVATSGALLITFNLTTFNLLASSTYALYVALGFRSIMNFNTEMLKILGIYSNFSSLLGNLQENKEYNGPFMINQIQKYEKLLLNSNQSQIKLQENIQIRFQNVKFKYKKQNNTGLKNFNLTIKPGKIIAITGSSGIGKSTLLNLLTKLYEPQSGNIFINNQNLTNKSDQFIQKHFSYVTQESFIFTGTFYSNLIYGNQGFDLSEQNIIKCLKIAQAYDFVMMKGGLKGNVKQKGSNLSGGQKQRLILARALVKHPKLLILDEATANIDHESQYNFYKNLKFYYKFSTCIIINHKLDQIQEFIDEKIEFEHLNN